ncbi:unnamed protein product [Arctia plantaginis]|uniref:Uncharacterized protein n=1 Tax=Arctia plantaginis TaxID=874455 RepID=A0A8S0ZA25_ARCPL|nr:unnamed protein product [Arctia plantaginis]CAB3227509.1 unnamed protein product [Arctia plantaginis]
MNFMDKLPTVISCCFCCFLRAGTVMIATFSFIIGILFAPNVSHSPGYWDMNPVLSNYSTVTEMTVQMVLGLASIMLCSVSILLLIGACCNIPKLIEIYQWGAIIYSSTVVLMFFILSMFCFFVHTNCYLAAGVLCVLIVCVVLFTLYFIIVTNSLRMSLQFLSSSDLVI